MNNLCIIGNEKIFLNKNNFYCANVDFKTITEGLKNLFNIKLIARKSNKNENFKLNLKTVLLSSSIIDFIILIIYEIIKFRKTKFLIISITPYTFCAYMILALFSSDVYLYLRSDGFKEYEYILGKKWRFLYRIMFFLFTRRAKIISCYEGLYNGKIHEMVQPSELDQKWFKNRKIITPNKKTKLLYVGRIRVEKGIINFLDLFNKLNKNFLLTVVGDNKIQLFDKRITFFYFFKNIHSLIRQYDKNDIFILPSYTEAHPKVIDEALSRLKPVVVFSDIKHVAKNRFGVFVVDRNLNQFVKKIKYIKRNYKRICQKISENVLPTKKDFLSKFSLALKKNNI
jgi:glycosyltransferase involved in cell wall biosynthesis